uniref:Anther protein n=1 Tax=Nicotiana tabacum TaxID=4097 RepID=Q8RX90_TOBAC|nr:anther protein [Nicotiana tabacum]
MILYSCSQHNNRKKYIFVCYIQEIYKFYIPFRLTNINIFSRELSMIFAVVKIENSKLCSTSLLYNVTSSLCFRIIFLKRYYIIVEEPSGKATDFSPANSTMAFLATTSPIHVLALLMLIFASTKMHHAQGKSITGPCVVACSKKTIACVVRCRFATDKCSQDCAIDSIHCVSSCLIQNTPPPTAMILDTDDSRDGDSMEYTNNFDLNPYVLVEKSTECGQIINFRTHKLQYISHEIQILNTPLRI